MQATVEDLDPPPALSISPATLVGSALMTAYERDYTHLTVLANDKSLLGYLSMPRLREQLASHTVTEADPVSKAMVRFRRDDGKRQTKFPYRIITMQTPLEQLERFFHGGLGHGNETQDFAVVTDEGRRFVLGVATREDLQKFVERRPA